MSSDVRSKRELAFVFGLCALACAKSTPSVSFSSPGDGERFFGSRDVTVQGSIGESRNIVSVVALQNGTPLDVTWSQTRFEFVASLDDNNNVFEVTAANKDGVSGSATLSLEFPFVTLTTFQAASKVIGQADFTSVNVGVSQARTAVVNGDPEFADGVFYVPDYENSRVLAFGGVPDANGASAEFVLGQPNFTASAPGTSAVTMDGPQTVQAHEGRLYVADYGNSRVLIWNALPKSTQVPANIVVGQYDFNTLDETCSANRLSGAESVFVIGQRLLVSDSLNNRVLIWNSLPTTSGGSADVVIGQSDFVHCAANDDDQDDSEDFGPTARTLSYPIGLWSDGQRLFVADAFNNRVLAWNAIPTANFQAADSVFGQPDMLTNLEGTTQFRFDLPSAVHSNGNQLFVADSGNRRILVWNTFPPATLGAEVVIGQGDFFHGALNDDNQDGLPDLGPTARTLAEPSGLTFIGDTLWVADRFNRRYIGFR
ncbi:MAG: hypothetical protein ACKVPX_17230 [Myxococcaceae bacterium]